MTTQLSVRFRRQKEWDSDSYIEHFEYSGDCHITIIQLIEHYNRSAESVKQPETKRPLVYDSNCEQGLCGACAMVVNGTPVLACQTFCDEVADGDGSLLIEPLTKFPVICDFSVDRAEIQETMKQMKFWIDGEASMSRKKLSQRSMASQCLMCGCCLEACPNYVPGDVFAGALASLTAMNLLRQSGRSKHRDEMRRLYKKRVFNDCTKVGACEKVCPMNIPVLTLMADANRLSVWYLWKIFAR